MIKQRNQNKKGSFLITKKYFSLSSLEISPFPFPFPITISTFLTRPCLPVLKVEWKAVTQLEIIFFFLFSSFQLSPFVKVIFVFVLWRWQAAILYVLLGLPGHKCPNNCPFEKNELYSMVQWRKTLLQLFDCRILIIPIGQNTIKF